MALSGPSAIAVEWSLAALAFIFVALRLYVRSFVAGSRLNIGDYLISLAWLCFVTCVACDTQLLNLGLLKNGHTYDHDLTEITSDKTKNIAILKIVYGSALPYYLDLWLIKFTLLSFYYSIIPRTSISYRVTLHVVTATVVGTMVMVLGINTFWCMPIHRNWSLNKQDICFSFASIPAFYTSVACNLVTDIAIFVLPFPLLRNLKLQQRSQLIALILVFCLAGITILATAIRLVVLANSATIAHVAVWSAVECSAGIIVAASPSFRILLRKRRLAGYNAQYSRDAPNHPSQTPTDRQSKPDWMRITEAELGEDNSSTHKGNRDTIKSHSTILTIPTVEELDEIISEKDGTQVRSIDDLQRWHDSVLFNRDSHYDAATVRPSYEWSCDKALWRYNDQLPPSPVTVGGLGVLPEPSVHLAPGPLLPPIPPLPSKAYRPKK